MASTYKYLSDNDRVVSTTELTTTASIVRSTDLIDKIRPATGDNNLFYVYGTGSIEKLAVSYGSGSSTGGVAGYDYAAARAYDQFAHTLLGYNADGTLKTFSGSLTASLEPNLAFYSIPRSLIKDKIASGSVLFVSSSTTASESGSAYSVQTGEARLLARNGIVSGAVFYEAGIIAINQSVIAGLGGATSMLSACNFITASATSISFQATTELNSTVYFCRAYNNEFNYSSNPTYLENSKIRVKDGDPTKEPQAYITTVGLYSDDNQLLAVAKLSEPIKKTASNELIIRTRLDF
jgi:hypothetical protein